MKEGRWIKHLFSVSSLFEIFFFLLFPTIFCCCCCCYPHNLSHLISLHFVSRFFFRLCSLTSVRCYWPHFHLLFILYLYLSLPIISLLSLLSFCVTCLSLSLFHSFCCFLLYHHHLHHHHQQPTFLSLIIRSFLSFFPRFVAGIYFYLFFLLLLSQLSTSSACFVYFVPEKEVEETRIVKESHDKSLLFTDLITVKSLLLLLEQQSRQMQLPLIAMRGRELLADIQNVVNGDGKRGMNDERERKEMFESFEWNRHSNCVNDKSVGRTISKASPV